MLPQPNSKLIKWVSFAAVFIGNLAAFAGTPTHSNVPLRSNLNPNKKSVQFSNSDQIIRYSQPVPIGQTGLKPSLKTGLPRPTEKPRIRFSDKNQTHEFHSDEERQPRGTSANQIHQRKKEYHQNQKMGTEPNYKFYHDLKTMENTIKNRESNVEFRKSSFTQNSSVHPSNANSSETKRMKVHRKRSKYNDDLIQNSRMEYHTNQMLQKEPDYSKDHDSTTLKNTQLNMKISDDANKTGNETGSGALNLIRNANGN